MRKSDRLFQLTNLIRSRQPVSAQDLANELNVSLRTIYRYINDLSVSGVPVYNERDVGYKLHRGYELAPPSLTQSEFDALVTGVKLVRSWTGVQFSAAAGALLHKIEAATHKTAVDIRFESVASPVVFERQREAEIWDCVQAAIRKHAAAYIHYADGNTQYTRRQIHPLNLSFWGNKWTVGAWCHMRSDYRDFRLDRIAKLEEVHGSQALPEHVCLREYMIAVTKNKPATSN